MLDLLKGQRRQSAVVNLPLALAANAVNILAVSAFGTMVGAKTLILKRIKIRNLNAGNTWVHIGTGAGIAFVDLIPALYSIANTTDDYEEGDIPERETNQTITAYLEAVGAGSFDIQIECEECG